MAIGTLLQRTRVKICGITRQEDALAAIAAGADALGLVFFAKSPRAVTPAQAAAIVQGLPPFVTIVGLFVDASAQWLDEVLAQVPLDLIQFHGNESPEQCAASGKPFIKAIRVSDSTDVALEAQRYAAGSGILVDAWHPTLMGGTGESFDWSRIPASLDLPVILAGGLNAGNVATAVSTVRPYAVDVSGGVESAKGIKSHQEMVSFVAAVNSVTADKLAK